MAMIEKYREEGMHAVNDEGVYMEDMIMEMMLGRPLAENETVLHHNGDTLDNRDSNLSLAEFESVQCDARTMRARRRHEV